MRAQDYIISLAPLVQRRVSVILHWVDLNELTERYNLRRAIFSSATTASINHDQRVVVQLHVDKRILILFILFDNNECRAV
jgi:hypothetical protein